MKKTWTIGLLWRVRIYSKSKISWFGWRNFTKTTNYIRTNFEGRCAYSWWGRRGKSPIVVCLLGAWEEFYVPCIRPWTLVTWNMEYRGCQFLRVEYYSMTREDECCREQKASICQSPLKGQYIQWRRPNKPTKRYLRRLYEREDILLTHFPNSTLLDSKETRYIILCLLARLREHPLLEVWSSFPRFI